MNIKKFDLEFTVDPLFKKTSADFDEGGARGLLLNHLSIHSNGKIIFDAGDVNTAVADDAQDAAPALLDLSKVKGTIFQDIQGETSRSLMALKHYLEPISMTFFFELFVPP